MLLECTETDYRRLLLCECVEAYLTLDKQQQYEYEQLLQKEPYREIVPMLMTTYEKGLARGREEGRAEGLRRAVQLQLQRRFGPLEADVLQRLEGLPPDRLEHVLVAVLDAPSLQALGLQD